MYRGGKRGKEKGRKKGEGGEKSLNTYTHLCTDPILLHTLILYRGLA